VVSTRTLYQTELQSTCSVPVLITYITTPIYYLQCTCDLPAYRYLVLQFPRGTGSANFCELEVYIRRKFLDLLPPDMRMLQFTSYTNFIVFYAYGIAVFKQRKTCSNSSKILFYAARFQTVLFRTAPSIRARKYYLADWHRNFQQDMEAGEQVPLPTANIPSLPVIYVHVRIR